MKRLQTTDFDVITGPSMASTCPVVETAPLSEAPSDTAALLSTAPVETERPTAMEKADAA